MSKGRHESVWNEAGGGEKDGEWSGGTWGRGEGNEQIIWSESGRWKKTENDVEGRWLMEGHGEELKEG